MTLPALDFSAPTRKRAHRTASTFQRQAAEWDLCVCPSCIAARPERKAILLRRRAVVKARFYVEE